MRDLLETRSYFMKTKEYEAGQLKIQQAEAELETSYHEELNYINEELEVMPFSSEQESHREDRVFKGDKNVQVNIKMPSSPIRLVRNAVYEIPKFHYCWCKHCFRNIGCKGSNSNL